MCNKSRISSIKEAPFSWKERDLLTAAEKYMKGAIDFPLVEFALPCFPELDSDVADKIAQVWRCTAASYHLQNNTKKNEDNTSNLSVEMGSIQIKAARMYEQEAQRILGAIFPLENKFWTAFYTRQELEETKPLVAIDALHFGTGCREQINYQLLLQSLKAILKGHYAPNGSKNEYFQNAKRLIIDLPMTPMQSWLNLQMI